MCMILTRALVFSGPQLYHLLVSSSWSCCCEFYTGVANQFWYTYTSISFIMYASHVHHCTLSSASHQHSHLKCTRNSSCCSKLHMALILFLCKVGQINAYIVFNNNKENCDYFGLGSIVTSEMWLSVLVFFTNKEYQTTLLMNVSVNGPGQSVLVLTLSICGGQSSWAVLADAWCRQPAVDLCYYYWWLLLLVAGCAATVVTALLPKRCPSLEAKPNTHHIIISRCMWSHIIV